MREIEVRWNCCLTEWEIYRLVLQGWAVAENVYSHYTEQDVRDYYGQFGRTVKFCTPHLST